MQINLEAEGQTAHLKDVSAKNFLEFLVESSWWVLQDLAVMQDTWATHDLYKHKVFKHRLWPEFKAKVVELHNSPDIGIEEVRQPGVCWQASVCVCVCVWLCVCMCVGVCMCV